MAIENWLTGAEMRAIATIVKLMDERKMSLGKLGGDVLRIPMSKLKKAGYSFRGCDIASDYRTLPQLRESLRKINMGAADTEESIDSLAEALAKVMAEIEGAKEAKESKPTTLRELGY